MAWTRHGHQIPKSTFETQEKRPPVARCGGVKLCAKCGEDAIRFYMEASFIPEALPDKDHTPMAFVTDNAGQPDQYIHHARQLVVEKYNRDIVDIVATELLAPEEVYIVWFSKTLQNWKALVSTDRSDGRYYEITYDGDKKQSYVDVYIKVSNEVIRDSDR